MFSLVCCTTPNHTWTHWAVSPRTNIWHNRARHIQIQDETIQNSKQIQQIHHHCKYWNSHVCCLPTIRAMQLVNLQRQYIPRHFSLSLSFWPSLAARNSSEKATAFVVSVCYMCTLVNQVPSIHVLHVFPISVPVNWRLSNLLHLCICFLFIWESKNWINNNKLPQ